MATCTLPTSHQFVLSFFWSAGPDVEILGGSERETHQEPGEKPQGGANGANHLSIGRENGKCPRRTPHLAHRTRTVQSHGHNMLGRVCFPCDAVARIWAERRGHGFVQLAACLCLVLSCLEHVEPASSACVYFYKMVFRCCLYSVAKAVGRSKADFGGWLPPSAPYDVHFDA